MLINLMT